MKPKLFFILLAALLAPIPVLAENFTSKYLGEEARAIKSLSPDDIRELKSGSGWGMAKAAELNGVPGPAHILEMKDRIGLTDKQKQEIEQLYAGMKAEAIPLGEKLIRLEGELNQKFTNRTINSSLLESYIQQIAQVRARLRLVHLSTHLKTPDILTGEQIDLYNQLRGYAKDDPCANIPEGHNATMWKKHHGCN